MVDDNDKNQNSGDGILLFFLLIGLLILVVKNKKIVPTTIGAVSDTVNTDTENLTDNTPVDTVNTDTENLTDNTSADTVGAGTTTQQVMAARITDASWQAQKARINMNLLNAYLRSQIEKGAITTNALRAIANYQAVKDGTMSATDFANSGGIQAIPESMREGFDVAGIAYQTSPTTVRNRALVYYAGLTNAHRGSMTAEQRTAWDSANLKYALEAYSAAAGSGNQATIAAALAANPTGQASTPSASTPPVTSSGVKSAASQGYATSPSQLVGLHSGSSGSTTSSGQVKTNKSVAKLKSKSKSSSKGSSKK